MPYQFLVEENLHHRLDGISDMNQLEEVHQGGDACGLFVFPRCVGLHLLDGPVQYPSGKIILTNEKLLTSRSRVGYDARLELAASR